MIEKKEETAGEKKIKNLACLRVLELNGGLARFRTRLSGPDD